MKNKPARNVRFAALCLVIVIITAWQAGYLYSASFFSEGTASAQILELPVDARAVAMGGAYSSISQGANSVYWNPASLTSLQSDSLGFMHGMFFESIIYDYLAYAFPLSKFGAFGLGVQYLNYGSIDKRDNLGNDEGSFVPKDTVISLAYAKMIRSMPIGVTVKFINSTLVNRASTAALDFGFILPIYSDSFTVGGTIKNLGGTLKYNNVNEPLPVSVNLGAAWRASRDFLVTGEIAASKTAEPHASAGAEYALFTHAKADLKIRGGYKTRTINSRLGGLAGLNSGIGLRVDMYEINYAWNPMGDLGTNHYISVSVDFGKDHKSTISSQQAASTPKYRTLNTANADYRLGSSNVNEKALQRMLKEYRRALRDSSYDLNDAEQFAKAVRLYNNGDYAESYKLFEVVNKYSGNNALAGEAQIGMAECALKLGDNELARSILVGLSNYLPAYRGDVRIKIIWAKLHVATGDYEKAIVAVKSDDSDDAVWMRVLAYREAAQYIKALAEARYHMEIYPVSHREEERALMMAELLYANKEYDKSVEEFRAFLRDYPSSSKAVYARYMIASSLHLQSKYKESYERFSELAAQKENREIMIKSMFLKAEAAHLTGNRDEAIKIYEKIANDRYSDILTKNAHYRICLINLQQDDIESLEKNSLRYSRRYGDPRFTMLYGLTQYLNNKTNRAYNYFNRALEQSKSIDDVDRSLALLSFVGSPSNTNLLIRQQVNSQNWERHVAMFFTAEGFYNEGLYGEAERIFLELESSVIDPFLRTLSEIRYADSMVQLGKYEEALLKYRRIEEKPSLSPEIDTLLLTGLGHVNVKMNRYSAAAGYYQRVINVSLEENKTAQVYYYLGMSYNKSGVYSKAIDTWVEMVKKFPGYEKSRQALNDALNLSFGMGDYNKVMSIAGFASELYANDKEMMLEIKMLVAKAQSNQRNFGRSVEIYQELIGGTTDQALKDRLERYLSQSYYQIGINNPGAEKLLDEFAQKYSNQSIIGEVYWQTGAKFFDSQRYDEAEKRFHKVVTHYPHSASAPQALFYLAESIYWQGNLDNALQYYETYERNYPEEVNLATTARFRMANAYFRQGRIPLAVDFYNKILKSGVNADIRKNSMLNLAMGLYRINEFGKSIESFKQFINEYSDSPEANTAKYQVARILRDEGKLDEAAEFYSQVAPTSEILATELNYRIAETYQKKGDKEKTIAAFRKLMPLRPRSDMYRFRGLIELAAILEENKDYKQVIEIFEELKKSTSDQDARKLFDAKIKEVTYKQNNNL